MFLLVGFVSIAVFGVFGMHADMQKHGSAGCIAATATGADCPQRATPADSLAFHATFFKSFSSAVFAGSVLSLLILGAILLIGFTHFRPVDFLIRFQRLADHSWFNFRAETLSPRPEFLRWLTRHENSPTLVF